MRKFLKALIYKPGGELSHSKFWSSIASIILCITFPVDAYVHGLTPEKMGVFGGLFVIGRGASKYLDTKTTQGGGSDVPEPAE